MNFPITKVFVGDGTNTGTNKDNMAEGDLLILDGITHAVLNDTSVAALGVNDPVVFVSKTSEGIIESPVIRKRDIKSVSFEAYDDPAQKVVTLSLETPVVGNTYITDLSIKSQHKELWNKNPSFLASFTAKTTDRSEMAANLHKQYTRNLFTSAGSSQQLVRVERTLTLGNGTATALGLGLTANMVVGSRTVTITGGTITAFTPGTIISLAGGVYLIESSTTTSFVLDTAYQGTALTAATGTGATNAFSVALGATSVYNLRFTGVAQPVKKWDWYAIVDFDVFKKGSFTSTSTVTVTTALNVGSGTYHQVRDLERKNYAHVRYAHNFTEHPAEDYVNNATVGVNYAIIVLEAATSGYGTWIKQQQDVNGVTLIFAAPVLASSTAGMQLDGDLANSFGKMFNTFVGSTIIPAVA